MLDKLNNAVQMIKTFAALFTALKLFSLLTTQLNNYRTKHIQVYSATKEAF